MSIDQVVAVNMRYWRRAAGLTQDELGQLLGWSAANVSAIERSAEPGREPRRFDAQTLAELALALGVPLAALFLPPPGDGERVSYRFTARGAEHDMDELTEFAVMPDNMSETPVMTQYRDRFNTAVTRAATRRHWTELAARWSSAGAGAERAGEAARFREHRERLLRAAADFGDLADAIDGTGP